MTTPRRVPSGRSSTAGAVPDGVVGTWSTGAPRESSRRRSGTYSPNGTRRTLSYRPVTSPVGVTITWALVNLVVLPGTSSVTPTEIGTSRRAASAATAAISGLPANCVTSTTFSGHSTRSSSSSGSIERVASTWRWVTRALGTSSARVPCSPPPCTAAMSRKSPVPCPRGASFADRQHGDSGEESGGCQARVGADVAETARQHPEGEADLEHHPREEDHTADADDSGERAGSLGNPQAGEWHTAERPEKRRPRRGVGERPADRAPPPVRGGDGGDDVERGVHTRWRRCSRAR